MSSFWKKVTAFVISLALFLSWHPLILAAEIHQDESVIITQGQALKNPYLLGEKIEVNAPVENDVVAAGGNIFLNGPVSGSVLAAGGNLHIKGTVANSVRVAGGDITIDGPITQDLLVFSGMTTITSNATISGDILFFGGHLDANGPVQGTIYANGGDVSINSTVGKDVQANVGSLTFGPNASVSGNVIYKSPQEASFEEGSVVRGETTYTQVDKERPEKEGFVAIFTLGTLYILVADILFVLFFILVLPRLSRNVVETINTMPLKSLGIGFVTLIFVPFASLLMLLILWLGITSFVLYGLLLLLSLAFTKLFVGWKILSWWHTRNNRRYTLNWMSALVGVIVVFVLGLIPVIGWIIAFGLFLAALGSLVLQLFSFISAQTETKTTKRK